MGFLGEWNRPKLVRGQGNSRLDIHKNGVLTTGDCLILRLFTWNEGVGEIEMEGPGLGKLIYSQISPLEMRWSG